MTERGEAIEMNLRQFYRSIARISGYDSGNMGGMEYAWNRGGTWPAHILGTPDEEGIGNLADSIRAGKLPPFLIMEQGPGLVTRKLEDVGIRTVRQWTGMILEPGDFRPAENTSGGTAEEVEAGTVSEWLAVVNAELITSAAVGRDFADAACSSGAFDLMLTRTEGQASCAGMLFTEKGISGIYLVATVKEFRKRGLGSYLCTELVKKAWLRGSRTIVLHATDMARHMYARLGFGEANRYQVMWLLGRKV